MPQPSLSAYHPSLGERLQQGISGLLGKVGVDPRYANHLGSRIFGALNDLTPVGNATMAADAGTAIRQGHPFRGAALGALAVLPGAAGKVAKKVGRGMFGGGIRAYHGSPHDFDKFSLSKIGTGEGAQAYGHGLYFAENRKVAEEYQRQLAGDVFTTPDGYIYDPHSRLEHLNVRSTLNRTGDLNAAITKAKDLLKTAPPATREMLESDLAGLEWAHGRGGLNRPKGHLYEVGIKAKPEDFLNWDARLDQQSERVRGGLANLSPLSSWTEVLDPKRIVYEPELLGQRAYRSLDGIPLPVGNQYVGLSQNRVPKMLQDQGIPGIRYLDQGSRGVGDGTHNYAVFDDSIIDILNKY